MNKGMAIGGPAAGQIFESAAARLNVPVKVGPSRGEGDRGFAPFYYLFSGGLWWGETTWEYNHTLEVAK